MAKGTDVVSTNRTVTTQSLKEALRRCMSKKRPAFIWGPPGIGKSETVAQLTEEMGGRLYDIRLSLMEPTDLRGIPFYNKENNRMDWAQPVDLPDAETASKYPIVVLLFDEMNSAPPAVQAACYQIALNRRVGQYVLPDNVVIVAAGNRDGDKGVTYRMPSPLANRFVHFELAVDFDSWQEWAVTNRIHQDVVGFLTFSKNSLYDFDPASPSRSFATPRSWSFVSELTDDNINDVTTTDIISGAIGEGLALKFLAHRKFAAKLPNPTDILSGKVTSLSVNEVSAHFSLATSCAYELHDKFKQLGETKLDDFAKMYDNYLKFSMDCFSTEVTILSIRMLSKVYNIPIPHRKLTHFDEFQKKYGDILVAAYKK